jgi:predicted metal-binding membrane protein
MLPSVAPTLLAYAAMVGRGQPNDARAALQVYALAGGYLLVWTLFSLAATLLQRLMSALLLLTPMMDVSSPMAGGTLLLVAGGYQLTPFKQACLQSCRSPLSVLMRHWRTGRTAAFRMGLEHGLNCLGCCWALMLLLFVGGVMNLYVIAAITAFVLFEKVAPAGIQGGRLSGVLLIGLGILLMAL